MADPGLLGFDKEIRKDSGSTDGASVSWKSETGESLSVPKFMVLAWKTLLLTPE